MNRSIAHRIAVLCAAILVPIAIISILPNSSVASAYALVSDFFTSPPIADPDSWYCTNGCDKKGTLLLCQNCVLECTECTQQQILQGFQDCARGAKCVTPSPGPGK